MCGLAGYVRRGGDADPALVEKMLARLGHRGPDGRGLWARREVALGHTRLSILDLSERGHQPMLTPDATGVLAYNGEVYNFRELRAELEAAGDTFHSSGDSEVVLHALHRWGPETAVPRFDGMFAFAYHDLRDGSVWLARDRLGIKPLYLARCPQGTVFASEIKALLAHPAVPCEPDLRAVITQIIDERIDGEITPFEGVENLAPGTLLQCARAERTVAYFDLLRDVDPQRIVDGGRIELARHRRDLGRLLEASVEKHLVSDAPLAVMCSGGLDSGLVTAFARHHAPGVKAYVADVEQMMGEEVRRARRACEHLGVELRPVACDTSTFFRLWPLGVYANDQPLYFPQNIAGMAVAERLRADGFKAVLSGDGADELFGGYQRYEASYRLWRRRRLRAEWLERLPPLRALARFHRWFQPVDLDALARHPFSPNATQAERALAVRQTAALSCRRDLRDAALFRKLSSLRRPEDRAFLAQSFADVYLHLGEGLRSHDRMFMAFSIENRVPFLENALIDFALHLPVSAKYRAGRSKRVVFELGRLHLPDDLIRLPKIGFWIESSMWRGVAPFLRDGFAAELLKWRTKEQDDLLDSIARYPRFLFRFVCVELWARIFFGGESPEQLSEALLRSRA